MLVSVSNCGERDLTKHFHKTNVDWAVVAKKLVTGGELSGGGRELLVDPVFSYLECDRRSVGASVQSPDKRGENSAAQQ